MLDQKGAQRVTFVAALAYLALVLVMWGPFGPSSGMPYETSFPYHSEVSSAWDGFLYRADPLRIHTNTFYHLSYLIGEALGIGGSFVPFQVVYALLWWARAFLVFLIVRKFLPWALPLSYLLGTLVIVHASDRALQWVGQLNQFGYIFWMLLAFYMLIVSFQEASPRRSGLYLLLALVFEYMSLWSYESQLLIMLVLPLSLLLLRRNLSTQWLVVARSWYLVALVYLFATVKKYLLSGGQTYQESILRKDWSILSILGDWGFNMSASLRFWAWAHYTPWKVTEVKALVLAVLAVVVFLSGAGIVSWSIPLRGHSPNSYRLPRKTSWAVMGVGLSLLALSFPAYLVLESARSLWRTQFLSGAGAALSLGSVIALTTEHLSQKWLRFTAFVLLGAVVVFFGSLSAVKKGGFHAWVWERHRLAVAQIIRAAPRIKSGAVIVMVNVPKNDDPFGHNMWYETALRLAYPGTLVAGGYFYDDGTPGNGNNLRLHLDKWLAEGISFPLLTQPTGIARTLIISYETHGSGRILPEIPDYLCHSRCALQLYRPVAVIEDGSPSPRAVRRYQPFPN